MKLVRFALIVVVLCMGMSSPLYAQSKLTNADVLKMVEGRVPSPIIVVTIERSVESNFELGPDALVELKKRGVPDAILEAMVKRMLVSSPTTTSASPAFTSKAGEWASREKGVYLEFEGATGKQVIMLAEAKITGMKIGGGLGLGAFGISISGKQTTRYRIRGGAAEKRAPSGGVTLYIAKIDPRDLVLIKVAEKGKEREFVGSKMDRYTANAQAAKGDFEFTTEEVVPGVYRVLLSQPLAPGEYGFGFEHLGRVGPIYDFGIDR